VNSQGIQINDAIAPVSVLAVLLLFGRCHFFENFDSLVIRFEHEKT
jgi:hypothetical protein